MLLDSNIVIYAARPEHRLLRRFIADNQPAVSIISYIEVLGYHKLTELERRYFGQFFSAAPVLRISDDVAYEAVRLRQHRKMTLGDALIAATALVHQLTVVTHNGRDFEWIPDLQVYDPLATDV